jgi:glutamine amidotransferase
MLFTIYHSPFTNLAMITLIDTQQSNISSVANMLRRIGVASRIAASPAEVVDAGKLILPGVGHFATVMRWLNETGYAAALNEAVQTRKTPILGICLGMALMGSHSEEGDMLGLNWVDAKVKEFKNIAPLPVPHMGWNDVAFRAGLFAEGYREDPRFYFVHSYYMQCANEADVLGTTHYGHDFVSAFQRGNVVGAQFHPEKSHAFGMHFLKRFAEDFK